MASDDSPSTALRVRHRVAQNLAVAVVVCLVLAGAGGFVAYEEYAAPDTTTERQTVATWTADSDFTHRATVQRSTRVFDSGTVLQNRSIYLTGITPVVNATHVYTHGGDAGPANVSTTVTLVKRAIGPTADGGTIEYWRVTDRLASRQTTLAAGQSRGVDFTINVTAQQNETRQIERELGGTPGQTELYALVTTRARTTLDGETKRETRIERFELQPGGATYAITENTTAATSEDVTEPRQVPIESNPLRIYGGALFALVGLGTAVGLVYVDRTDRLAVPEATVATIRTARARERFDEWISRGTVPEPGDDSQVVPVASLADLVDVAIDSERRVIEDRATARFVVIVDDTWYCYEPSQPATAEGDEQETDSQRRPAEHPEREIADGNETEHDQVFGDDEAE